MIILDFLDVKFEWNVQFNYFMRIDFHHFFLRIHIIFDIILIFDNESCDE